jgi:hypothetical protein
MDSIIELQRQNHEEIERFERALYTLLSRNQPTHESKLLNEHKASQVLDRISSRGTALNNLYSDQVGRKAEIDMLSAPQQQNDLSEFYSRLVKIQEHHSKYPDATPGGFDLELAALLEEGNQDGIDEEYEEEDCECHFIVIVFCIRLTVRVLQPSLFCFPVKRHTANMLTCIPTIPRIITSKILGNGLDTSSTSMFFS